MERKITIGSRSSLTSEGARDTRARARAFVFECWQDKQRAAESTQPSDRDDTVMVRHTEEVTHLKEWPNEALSVDHHRFTKEDR
jgi:hypothetical protein